MSDTSSSIVTCPISRQPDYAAQTAEVDLRIWSAIQYLFVGVVLVVARRLPSPGFPIVASLSITTSCLYSLRLERRAAWKEREITRVVREYVDCGMDPDEICEALLPVTSDPDRQSVLQHARWQKIAFRGQFVALPAMLLVSHFWGAMVLAVTLGVTDTVVKNKLQVSTEPACATAKELASTMPNIEEVIRRELVYIRIFRGPPSSREKKEVVEKTAKETRDFGTPAPNFEPFTPRRPPAPFKRPLRTRAGTPLSPIPLTMSPMLNRSVRAEVDRALASLDRSKATLPQADATQLATQLEELGREVDGLQEQFAEEHSDREVEAERAILHASVVQLHQSICAAKVEQDPTKRQQLLEAIQKNLDEIPARYRAYRALINDSIGAFEESYQEASSSHFEKMDEILKALQDQRDPKVDAAFLKTLQALYEQVCRLEDRQKASGDPGGADDASDRAGHLTELITGHREILQRMESELQKVTSQGNTESAHTRRLLLALQEQIDHLHQAGGHDPQEMDPAQLAPELEQMRAEMAVLSEQLSRLASHVESAGGNKELQEQLSAILQAIASLETQRAGSHHGQELSEVRETLSAIQTAVAANSRALAAAPQEQVAQLTRIQSSLDALQAKAGAEQAPAVSALAAQLGALEEKLQQQLSALAQAIASRETQPVESQESSALTDVREALRAIRTAVAANSQAVAAAPQQQAALLTDIQSSLAALKARADAEQVPAVSALTAQLGALEEKLQTQLSALAQAIASRETQRVESQESPALTDVRETLRAIQTAVAANSQSLAAAPHEQAAQLTRIQSSLDALEQAIASRETQNTESHQGQELTDVREALRAIQTAVAANSQAVAAAPQQQAALLTDIQSSLAALKARAGAEQDTAVSALTAQLGALEEKLQQQLSALAQAIASRETQPVESQESSALTDVREALRAIQTAVAANSQALATAPQEQVAQLTRIQSSIDALQAKAESDNQPILNALAEQFQTQCEGLSAEVKVIQKRLKELSSHAISSRYEELQEAVKEFTRRFQALEEALMRTQEAVAVSDPTPPPPSSTPPISTGPSPRTRRRTLTSHLRSEIQRHNSSITKADRALLEGALSAIAREGERGEGHVNQDERINDKLETMNRRLTGLVEHLNDSSDGNLDPLLVLKKWHEKERFSAYFWEGTFLDTLSVIMNQATNFSANELPAMNLSGLSEERMEANIKGFIENTTSWKASLKTLLDARQNLPKKETAAEREERLEQERIEKERAEQQRLEKERLEQLAHHAPVVQRRPQRVVWEHQRPAARVRRPRGQRYQYGRPPYRGHPWGW